MDTDTLKLIIGAGGWAGFIASVFFNVRQYYELKRTKIEQGRKEQVAPAFFNFDGSDAPIRISGKEHSATRPMMDLYCSVTIVNYAQMPTKITPVRLVLDGDGWPLDEFFFREKGARERFKKISLTGNNKEDYELHFMFSDNNHPQSKEGEFWLYSDNRPDPFAVKVKFP